MNGSNLYKRVFDLSLNQHIELDYKRAVDYIKAIGKYNDFQADNVIKMLEEYDQLIPQSYYNDGNPNNGKRDYTIKVGREHSPVMYLELIRWESLGGVRELTELLKRREEFERIALKLGRADEFAMTHQIEGGYHCLQIRVWWD